MPITRRNLLHGMAAAGTVIAASSRSLNPGRPVSEVLAHLEKNDVHIAPPIPAMDKYVRVSLGTPPEMHEFWRVWDLMLAGKMSM